MALTWEEPDIDSHNGIIRHYTALVLPLSKELEPVSVTTSRRVLDIAGLHPFTTYAISVTAFTVDLGPASENVTVTTMESRMHFLFVR